MNIFKKIRDTHNKNWHLKEIKQAKLMEASEQVRQEIKDYRYNEPKGKHKAKEDVITETIESNDIYSRAKERILTAQRKQVGYGLDKYPEPLCADTWTTIETIDHIIDEAVDKLHYLVMLRIKLEGEAYNKPVEDKVSHSLYDSFPTNLASLDLRNIVRTDEEIKRVYKDDIDVKSMKEADDRDLKAIIDIIQSFKKLGEYK